jgi:hypothetical protein
MTTNSTGMHRKTRTTDHAVMIRHLATGFALFALTVALLATLFTIATPSVAAAPAANPAMFQPAANAAAHLRPVWDGYRPARWTGPDAMCPASSARLHRWARADQRGPWFRVECLPDGPGPWAWSAIVKR